MKRTRGFFLTLLIGTIMAFPMGVSADEAGGGGSESGTVLQAKPDGEPGGVEYTHRNTWNHRNTKRNRSGDAGESVEAKRGHGFVDENGDGINDLAPDHDGDGVPNGQDTDWVKNKRDGTGNKQGVRGEGGGKWCERSQLRGSKGARAAR